MRTPRLTAVFVLLALIGGLSFLALRPGGSAADSGVLRVTLSEWKVTPERQTVKAGPLTIETENTGRVEHELLIVRTDRAPGDLPLGLQGPALTGAGQKLVLGRAHGHASAGAFGGLGRTKHIQPGRIRRDSVTLAPGRYVLLCNLPQHYESGQRVALTVTR